ncbi:hypothetical protein RSAG8_12548, partial [Rhizoctonia solani AG-8 WAC10335]
MSAQRHSSSLSNARFRPFAGILSSPVTTLQRLVSRMRGASPLESSVMSTSTSWISAPSSVSRSHSRSQSPRLLPATSARTIQPLALASTSTLVSPPPSYPGSMVLPSPTFAPNTTTYVANPPVPRLSPEASPGNHVDRSASINSSVSESPEPAIGTTTAGRSRPIHTPAHSGSDTDPHRHFPGTICLCGHYESTPAKISEKEQPADRRVRAGSEERVKERVKAKAKERAKERVARGKELESHHETTEDDSIDGRSSLSCTCPKWYLNCVLRRTSKCIEWIDTLPSLEVESGEIVEHLSAPSEPSQPSLAALVAMHFEVPLDLAAAPCADTVNVYEFAGDIEAGRVRYTPPLPGQASYNTWFYLPEKDRYRTQNACRGIGDIDIIPHPTGPGFMYFVFCEVPGEPLQYYWAGYELGECHPLHSNYYLYHFENHAPMWIGQASQPEKPYDARPRILDEY